MMAEAMTHVTAVSVHLLWSHISVKTGMLFFRTWLYGAPKI